MNNRFHIALLFCVVALTNASIAHEPFTNNIVIQKGFRLSLSDEASALPSAIMSDLEVIADRNLFWLLMSFSSTEDIAPSQRSVIYVGTNSFDVKLLSPSGQEVKKTKLGEIYSLGPASKTDLSKISYIRRIGGPDGNVSIMDFPKLTELFEIKDQGPYVLEFRYWVWKTDRQSFVLSDPIRLRVIKTPK